MEKKLNHPSELKNALLEELRPLSGKPRETFLILDVKLKNLLRKIFQRLHQLEEQVEKLEQLIQEVDADVLYLKSVDRN